MNSMANIMADLLFMTVSPIAKKSEKVGPLGTITATTTGIQAVVVVAVMACHKCLYC